jgi:hypothetical protein
MKKGLRHASAPTLLQRSLKLWKTYVGEASRLEVLRSFVDTQITDRQNVDTKITNRQNIDTQITNRQNVDTTI